MGPADDAASPADDAEQSADDGTGAADDAESAGYGAGPADDAEQPPDAAADAADDGPGGLRRHGRHAVGSGYPRPSLSFLLPLPFVSSVRQLFLPSLAPTCLAWPLCPRQCTDAVGASPLTRYFLRCRIPS